MTKEIEEKTEEVWQQHSRVVNDSLDDASYFVGREIMVESDFKKAIKSLLTPPADVQERAKEECTHEALVDTGIGYYHCRQCNSGWTYKDWEDLSGASSMQGEVERLKAENERLREALEKMLEDIQKRRLSHAKKKQESMDSYQDQYCHGRIDELDYMKALIRRALTK
jgi:hypothetical protein